MRFTVEISIEKPETLYLSIRCILVGFEDLVIPTSSKISHRLILDTYSISSGGCFKYNLDDNGGSPLSSFQAFFKFDPDEEY